MAPRMRITTIEAMSKLRPELFSGVFKHAPVATVDSTVSDGIVHLPEDKPLLLAYATAMGAGEDIALDTAELLSEMGVATRTVDFYDIRLDHLLNSEQALFIISTYVCGSAPDMAEDFKTQVMNQPAPLSHLRYGLLALGDSIYDDDYCRFGYAFDDWLKASNATPWFARVDVDDEDENDLNRWNTLLSSLALAASA